MTNTSATATSLQSVESLQHWLIERVSVYIGIDPGEIDITQPFTRYGLGSRDGLRLTGELEDWLACKLSPSLVWEYPSIDTLSRYLAGEHVESELASQWEEEPGW